MSADSIEKIADLLPCPFCGPGESVVEAWDASYKPGWRVGCGRCGSHSGHHYSREQAVTAWNHRALPSAELERDAGRYRCIRPSSFTRQLNVVNGDLEPLNDEELDAAVDAARDTEAKR